MLRVVRMIGYNPSRLDEREAQERARIICRKSRRRKREARLRGWGATMASDEANAIKDVASKIDDLGNVGREIDQLKRAVDTVAGNLKDVGRVEREIDPLKRAVDSLAGELKELRKFTVLKDVIGDTNDSLAKIADELRKIREQG